MSANTRDAADPTAPDEPGDEESRYAAFEVEDGSVVVYDRHNHRAWLQSDGAVALAARC